MDKKRSKQFNFAFTLIELLVVIAIIGILSALIVVVMNGATNSARDAKAKSELASLQKALLSYGTAGSFPVSSPSPCIINNTTVGVGCTGASGLNTLLVADGFNLPPASSNYGYTSNGTSFSLRANNTNRIYTVDYFRPNSLSCPANWIDTGHGFCVMQYEARGDGTTNCTNAVGAPAACPISQTAGTPWVSISQLDAIAACSSLGSGSHLITNAEWMAIANDVVNVGTNWTVGVGNGVLARGFVNGSNTAVAPTTGAGSEYNTGANTVGGAGTVDYRRTLYLANNNIIWDLSGNVFEWTNDTITGSGSQSTPNGWKQFNAVASWGALTSTDVITANNATLCGGAVCTSTNGVGRFLSETSLSDSRVLMRGAAWSYGTYAGVFALRTTGAPVDTSDGIGFRCAR